MSLECINLAIKRKWLSLSLFSHPELKIQGYNVGDVSRNVLPKNHRIYGVKDDPQLPSYSAGLVVAKNIEISGFNTNQESTARKLDQLRQGHQSKILNFRISSPKNAQKVEFFDDSILIKEPCILGQTVEAFVNFPPLTTKERGAQSCLTDGFLSRAILGTGKSGE